MSKTWLVAPVALLVFAVLHVGLAERVGIWGATPHFFLLVALSLALALPTKGAIWAAYFAAVLQGALNGADYGPIVFSTCIAAFVVNRSTGVGVELGAILGGIAVAIGTLGALGLMLLVNPNATLGPATSVVGYLQMSLATAVYNGVLAVPLIALLRRALKVKSAGI